MFATFKHKLRDVATVATLSKEAERAARSLGNNPPGSEHYVLASLTLPDNTASRVFDSLGLTSDAFASAIRAQYIASLEHVGISPSSTESASARTAPSVGPKPKLFVAAASGQALMQRVATSATARRSRPLLGADVLLATTEEEFSVTARAFRQLGVERAALSAAAAQAIQNWAVAASDG